MLGGELEKQKKYTLQSEKNDDMRNLLRNNLKCIWLRSISHLSWEHNSQISIINLFSISNGDRERARARRASQHIKTYFFVLSEWDTNKATNCQSLEFYVISLTLRWWIIEHMMMINMNILFFFNDQHCSLTNCIPFTSQHLLPSQWHKRYPTTQLIQRKKSKS